MKDVAEMNPVRGPGWPATLPEARLEEWRRAVSRGQRWVIAHLRWIPRQRPADAAPHDPDPSPLLVANAVRSYWKRRSAELDWRQKSTPMWTTADHIQAAIVDLETGELELLQPY